MIQSYRKKRVEEDVKGENLFLQLWENLKKQLSYRRGYD